MDLGRDYRLVFVNKIVDLPDYVKVRKFQHVRGGSQLHEKCSIVDSNLCQVMQ
jgi:hypothetical protein